MKRNLKNFLIEKVNENTTKLNKLMLEIVSISEDLTSLNDDTNEDDFMSEADMQFTYLNVKSHVKTLEEIVEKLKEISAFYQP